MRRFVRLVGLLLLVFVLCVTVVLSVSDTERVDERGPGLAQGTARTAESVAADQAAQDRARDAVGALAAVPRDAADASGPRTRRPPAPAKSILFGDLHVHSTFSIDAFVYSLPVFGGEGAHPPADACDFARHCSRLDFFSMNDHAEGLTPARWRETIESVRQCNALAGDPASPDLVAYVGWEWTQAAQTIEAHYGHRNVIYPGLADAELPARPITALDPGTMDRARAMGVVRALSHLGPLGLGEYADFLWLVAEMTEVPDCPRGVHVGELAPDCRENAPTPAELFEKLAQWELPALVIPHGLAWGLHAPPGSSVANSLAQHDPAFERLVEVFSGHGNSEEYRSFAEYEVGADGGRVCPEPTPDYLPCCWRAGEIMRARCGDLSADACEARVARARALALDAGVEPHRVFPDTRQEEWLDCDQCRDCFKPAYNLRPRESAQYSLALRRFDEAAGGTASPGELAAAGGRTVRSDTGAAARGPAQVAPAADRFRYGFIASTDGHRARPGTGYKQYARRRTTDARGLASPRVDRLARPWIIGPPDTPDMPWAPPQEPRGLRGLFDVERVASFMVPGGLVAVHATARDRHSIFDALMRREAYGTSGPRILLWFDLLAADGRRFPMGSAVRVSGTPRFEVRAVGAAIQQPGCPAESHAALAPERLERLCLGECNHPGDERHPIESIEVVRIRPQAYPDEPVADRIEDPWRRHTCPRDPAGCVLRFEDPEFAADPRDSVYYVRALQSATPAINAGNLRTEFGPDGAALRTRPCHGSYRTPFEDDCLELARERAWSSPIYVDADLDPREAAGG